MKKILILGLIAFGLWNHFDKDSEATPIEPLNMHVPEISALPTRVISSSVSSHTFSCDGRQYCTQMNSRAEAEYFVRNCPNTKMDGDDDGIPCERDSRW
ncbi:excalibur calcium-binding domain-containing protein [Shewanella sp. SNU WT4]|uniref:excalibur calcium-binding domain-containing protein n=1 Tax=Shewanella sp. SNU WT4 TaxID=2590015 RepID=UPI00112ED771|nr:excalibur calcium-binding domain-containing protein [Shewanella sp. SNU WT4]QDF66628.1 excalibur calcium-binding domain-containing protein [Shewanella sp. SNU WT4]